MKEKLYLHFQIAYSAVINGIVNTNGNYRCLQLLIIIQLHFFHLEFICLCVYSGKCMFNDGAVE
jgi:hypothetical protein